jgi:hypothetical protein
MAHKRLSLQHGRRIGGAVDKMRRAAHFGNGGR